MVKFLNEISVEKLLEILNLNLDNEITTEQVDEDLQKYGMDSVRLLGIIVSLEEEFEVIIPRKFLVLPEMDTVNKMVHVLQYSESTKD